MERFDGIAKPKPLRDQVSEPKAFNHPRPLADLIEPALGASLKKQGFASADLLLTWTELVGERLAAVSQPRKILWPRKPRGLRDDEPEPGVLVLRVEGGLAIEIQHMAPLIVERVNAYYGWRAIARLTIEQGVLRRAKPRKLRPEPSPEAQAEAQARSQGIADEGLREAVARLGALLIDKAHHSS
jgi:hypothetical protein